MASSATAERITAAHQSAQAKLVAPLYLLLLQRWRQVRPEDVDSGFRSWLAASVPTILSARQQSARLAARYYQAFRAAETGSLGSVQVELAEAIERPRLEMSLRISGPISFKKRMRRIVADEPTIADSLKLSGRMAAAAAVRHTLDGGRDTIAQTSDKDEVALGYFRVTRADPCYFCAMLASRGPVYSARAFDASDPRFEGGEGHARVHDSCNCSLEPAFSRDAEWPGRAREFEELWRSASSGKSGQAAVLAFRRAYEGRS